jgi:hypothetical protein
VAASFVILDHLHASLFLLLHDGLLTDTELSIWLVQVAKGTDRAD